MNHQIRVLHVDDDPQFTDLTARYLRRENSEFEMVTETHAETAFEYLGDADTEIDCIVSDFALPDLHGLEFLEAVREKYPNLPFILFTGMGSETVAGDALTAGATDYLQKKGGTEQYRLLAHRIEDAVEQYRIWQERARSEHTRQQLSEITTDARFSIDEKINRLLELGCEQVGVENGHVVKIDPSSDRHEIRYAAGSDLVKQGTVTDLQETYCRRTLTADGILSVYNAEADEWEADPAYEKWGIGCYIGGRIDIGDDLYGTVCFVNRQPREMDFREGERSFVDLLTRWLSHMFERREHERTLREEKERFELLVGEVSTHAIFMLDPEGYVVSWNEGARNIKGYEDEEIIGQHFSTFYIGEQVSDGLPDRMLATAEKEGRAKHEGWRVRKDGARFWAQVSITALHDDEGELRGFGKVTQDLTDRRKQEEMTREIEEQFDTLPDIFYVVNEEGRFERFNQRLVETSGYTEEELDSIHSLELVPEDERDRFREQHEQLLQTDDVVTIESWLVTKDGTHIPHEFRRRRLTDEDGEVLGFAGIARDITQRKESERQLEQHVDRLNEFASVLTHDLRNPLSVAKSHLPMVEQSLGEDDHVDAIDCSLDRIEAVIEDVLEITRTGLSVTEPEPTDVSALATQVWNEMEKGAVHPDLEIEEMPDVMADSSLLERMLMNLFRNAVEHGGKAVRVRVGPLEDGFYIEDDGPGIPPAERERIFDWKFTTKVEGSGVGLKSVDQIVQAHTWAIEVTESDEGGARFEITGVEST